MVKHINKYTKEEIQMLNKYMIKYVIISVHTFKVRKQCSIEIVKHRALCPIIPPLQNLKNRMKMQKQQYTGILHCL